MRDSSGLDGGRRWVSRDRRDCGIGATPEVRKRLLALAVAVFAPVLLPVDAEAQSSASGTVRLIIRADALPRSGSAADSSAFVPDEASTAGEESKETSPPGAGEEVALPRSQPPALVEPAGMGPDSVARRPGLRGTVERQPG